MKGFWAAYVLATCAEIGSDPRWESLQTASRRRGSLGCLRKGGTREAGNGTTKTRRSHPWTDSLIEHGPGPLHSPQLPDCFCGDPIDHSAAGAIDLEQTRSGE